LVENDHPRSVKSCDGMAWTQGVRDLKGLCDLLFSKRRTLWDPLGLSVDLGVDKQAAGGTEYKCTQNAPLAEVGSHRTRFRSRVSKWQTGCVGPSLPRRGRSRWYHCHPARRTGPSHRQWRKETSRTGAPPNSSIGGGQGGSSIAHGHELAAAKGDGMKVIASG
jgi:hypothetical protein